LGAAGFGAAGFGAEAAGCGGGAGTPELTLYASIIALVMSVDGLAYRTTGAYC